MKKYYARPDGWHYHTDRNCVMLSGDQFDKLNYKEVTFNETLKRCLIPCPCAYSIKKK